MTPEELPNPPRKASWKRWIVVLAGVVAVITIAPLAIPPKNEPVKVWFVRSRNEFGYKELFFQGTNTTRREIEFVSGLFTGVVNRATTRATSPPFYGWIIATAAVGTNSCFSLVAPSNDVPYCVIWEFHDSPRALTRWGRFRKGCHDFLNAHGMPALAERLAPTPKIHYIPSTEIKE